MPNLRGASPVGCVEGESSSRVAQTGAEMAQINGASVSVGSREGRAHKHGRRQTIKRGQAREHE